MQIPCPLDSAPVCAGIDVEQQRAAEALERSRAALTQAMHTEQNRLFRLAYGILHNVQESQDVLQDVFCNMLASTVILRTPAGYLFTMVRNHAIKVLQARKRWVDAPLLLERIEAPVCNKVLVRNILRCCNTTEWRVLNAYLAGGSAEAVEEMGIATRGATLKILQRLRERVGVSGKRASVRAVCVVRNGGCLPAGGFQSITFLQPRATLRPAYLQAAA